MAELGGSQGTPSKLRTSRDAETDRHNNTNRAQRQIAHPLTIPSTIRQRTSLRLHPKLSHVADNVKRRPTTARFGVAEIANLGIFALELHK